MAYIERLLDESAGLTIPEQLNALGMKELGTAFQEMLGCPKELQDAMLKQIIAHGRGSRFGQEHNFANIQSYEDYIRAVPVTEYAGFLPYVDDICKNGDRQQLFDGGVEAMISTSGTTGKFKLFPESSLGAMAKNQVTRMRTLTVMGILEKEMRSGGRVLALSNYADHGKTESGIPVMASSGFTVRQISAGGDPEEAKRKWEAQYVLPYDLVNAKGLSQEESNYLSALFFLKAGDLIAVCGNNLDHVGALLTCIEKSWPQMVQDLENGEISIPLPEELKRSLDQSLKPVNPDRVREIKAAFDEGKGLQPDKLWPRLLLAYCWLAGSVGWLSRGVLRRLPRSTRRLDIGYGASEGKFNVPLEAGKAGAPMMAASVFFEFKPLDGGEIVTADRVEDGKCYDLVITTFSGLYRYDLHDLVKVCGKTGNTPNIEFVGKASEALECAGRTVYAKDLIETVGKTEQALGCFVSLLQCFKTPEEKLGFLLQTELDGIAPETLRQTLADSLEQTVGLPLDRIYLMKDGYRDSLYQRKVENGTTINATKLALIVDGAPDDTDMLREVL